MTTLTPNSKRTHSQLSPDTDVIKDVNDLRKENENNKNN